MMFVCTFIKTRLFLAEHLWSFLYQWAFKESSNYNMIFPTFHRILNDAVVNFPNNQEEITLVVSPETLKVKNYVDDEPGKKKKQKWLLFDS